MFRSAPLVSLAAAVAVAAFSEGVAPPVIRGVNLGGWLVLEPWITPSLFPSPSTVDEWTFGCGASSRAERADARARITQHWETFYGYRDLVEIRQAGLTHVRIPVGYWAVEMGEGEPYCTGQLPYLKQGVKWAAAAGLKVWVDLHGVPGSQNGFDNSGHWGEATWHMDEQNKLRSLRVIDYLAREFSRAEYAGAVESIELVNEPAGFIDEMVVETARQYYLEGYRTVTNERGLRTVIHDAFKPLSQWKDFMTPAQGYDGVQLDTHIYSVFSPQENAMGEQERINVMCNRFYDIVESPHAVIVGEFSLAPTDCALYLNGRRTGSRHDGTYPGAPAVGSCAGKTGSGDDFSASYKSFLRKFYDAQVQTWELAGQGWFFWTWKNEQAAEWSYKRGLELGFIPHNPGERLPEDVCKDIYSAHW